MNKNQEECRYVQPQLFASEPVGFDVVRPSVIYFSDLEMQGIGLSPGLLNRYLSHGRGENAAIPGFEGLNELRAKGPIGSTAPHGESYIRKFFTEEYKARIQLMPNNLRSLALAQLMNEAAPFIVSAGDTSLHNGVPFESVESIRETLKLAFQPTHTEWRQALGYICEAAYDKGYDRGWEDEAVPSVFFSIPAVFAVFMEGDDENFHEYRTKWRSDPVRTERLMSELSHLVYRGYIQECDMTIKEMQIDQGRVCRIAWETYADNKLGLQARGNTEGPFVIDVIPEKYRRYLMQDTAVLQTVIQGDLHRRDKWLQANTPKDSVLRQFHAEYRAMQDILGSLR